MNTIKFFGVGPIYGKILEFQKLLVTHGHFVKFGDHNTNVNAVKQLLEWLKLYNGIPNIVLQNAKDNHNAEILRKSGDKILNDGQNLSQAMCLYNQSICWGEYCNTSELSIAFAKRAAVYFAWEEYDLCMDNIEVALGLQCPPELIDELVRQRTLCAQFLEDSSKRQKHEKSPFTLPKYTFDIDYYRDVPSLSFDANPRIPFIADCLEIKINSVYGSHIITKDDLKPGQIIAMEEPFVRALTKPYRYRKCANCFKENYMNLIPCQVCTSTMFCSKECYRDGQKFHKFECPIAEYIWEQCEEYALPLRLTVKAFTIFDSVDDLTEFCKITTYQPFIALTKDKELFNQVNNLLTNEAKRPQAELFVECCKVAILYHFLIEKTQFSRMLQTAAHRNTLISLLLRYTQISSTNAINGEQLYELNIEHPLTFNAMHVFSRGIYPFSSLFNHSCHPNTSTIAVESKIVTYVTRPIKSNSQVYGCYRGIHHLMHTLACRKKALDVAFFFNCKCEACVKNYPNFNTIKNGNFMTPGEVYFANTYNWDLSHDVFDVKTFSTLLERFDEQYPCIDLARIRLRLHRAMCLKYGKLATEVKAALRHNVKYY